MRVLVGEDNSACRELLKILVEKNNWAVETAATGSKVLELVSSEKFDVVLLDINLPEVDGFEILHKIHNARPDLRVIIISGSIGVSETVRAMKMGAYHCFAKPFSLNEIGDSLKKLAANLPNAPIPTESASEMVAVSTPMLEMNLMLPSVAKSKTSTVLITGETGTGKEVVARRLHRLSERRDKPFVAVNCSAIPPTLIESELFGHEKGSFTDAKATRKGYFETAADGTVFLDEIGDLSLELQSKLLRVLQERNFRRVGGSQEIPLQARVIAATNVDLATAVRRGRFREDLYYRLAVIPIHLLPLRDRAADILPLAERFILHFTKELNCQSPDLSDEHKRLLQTYSWPGNVRELRNVIERFVLMDGQIEFVAPARCLENGSQGTFVLPGDQKADLSVDSNERKMIYELLLKKLLASETLSRPEPLINTL